MGKVGDALQNAKEEFPPTLDKGDIENRVFMLTGTRLTTTRYGERHIGTIRLNGSDETSEAWLDGVFLTRQLERLIKDELLPCLVKLVRDDSFNGAPWAFVEPTDEEKAEWEKAAPVQANPDQSTDEMPKAVSVAELYTQAEAKSGAKAFEALEGAGLSDVLAVGDDGSVVEAKMSLGNRVKAIKILKELI